MRRPLIGGKDFKTSIGREQAQGGVMGSLPRRILCVFWEKKEECVREKISSYVWKKNLFMKKQNVCKQITWEEVVCSK
jgi:hypothetical protein